MGKDRRCLSCNSNKQQTAQLPGVSARRSGAGTGQERGRHRADLPEQRPPVPPGSAGSEGPCPDPSHGSERPERPLAAPPAPTAAPARPAERRESESPLQSSAHSLSSSTHQRDTNAWHPTANQSDQI